MYRLTDFDLHIICSSDKNIEYLKKYVYFIRLGSESSTFRLNIIEVQENTCNQTRQ